MGKFIQKQEESKSNSRIASKKPQSLHVMALRPFAQKIKEIGSLKPLPAYVTKKKNSTDKT
jgi:hypothetical protein